MILEPLEKQIQEMQDTIKVIQNRMQKMRDALKIIHIWSAVAANRFRDGFDDDYEREFRDIAKRAEETLNG